MIYSIMEERARQQKKSKREVQVTEEELNEFGEIPSNAPSTDGQDDASIANSNEEWEENHKQLEKEDSSDEKIDSSDSENEFE